MRLEVELLAKKLRKQLNHGWIGFKHCFPVMPMNFPYFLHLYCVLLDRDLLSDALAYFIFGQTIDKFCLKKWTLDHIFLSDFKKKKKKKLDSILTCSTGT